MAWKAANILCKLTFLVLVVISVAWLIATTEAFQTCVKSEKYNPRYREIHEPIGAIGNPIEVSIAHADAAIRTIFVRFRFNVDCAAVFADKNGNAITALATFLISIFTYTLWRATMQVIGVSERQHGEMKTSTDVAKQAADAATKSASAAIGVELPRFEIDSVKTMALVTTSAHDALRGGYIAISFRNHGRTAAHILEDCITAELPEYDFLAVDVAYHVMDIINAELGSTVGPNNVHTIDCRKRITITENDAKSIRQEGKTLWLYGFIRYRDFLGDLWHTRYCVTYSRRTDGSFAFREVAASPSYVGHYRDAPPTDIP